MGTSALISLGTRALFANYSALQAVGQNIANANTPGYSRQSVELANSEGQYTGAGFFGKGVDVATVTRSHDQFLTREAATALSIASMDQARSGKLSELEKVFGRGNAGLGFAASQFLNAMVDISNKPADPSARQAAMARAQEAAASFANAGNQMEALQQGVVMDMKSTVANVNQIAQQIAQANDKIAAVQGAGHTPNDLLDQRDQLVSQLSQFLQVTTMVAPDGTMGVFIGGGQRLVLGSAASELAVLQNEFDPARVELGIKESNGSRVLNPNSLGGGAITGLLQYQNTDLQDARNLVGQLTVAYASEVNKQQALGLDLTSAAGTTGAPMFTYGGPRALPSNTNARDPSGAFASSVELTITDAQQLKASSYEMKADPAGDPSKYEITRLSDGLKRLVSDGDTIDGFKITLSATPPGTADRFLLQTVTRAANDMKRVLDNPNGIAAASPVTGTLGANNKGTATIASVGAVNSSLDLSKHPVSIVFGDPDVTDPNQIDYTLTLADGSSVTGKWSAGKPIGNDPAGGMDLGFELRLNGIPKKDDVVNVNKTLLPAASNGNALAFLTLRDKAMVGRQLQPDGSTIGGANIVDAYAATLSEIGVRVQGAATRFDLSNAVSDTAEKARSAKSGVNLDEEAARLMEFQQSYQAAAKVLQVAQTVFDTLLQVAAR